MCEVFRRNRNPVRVNSFLEKSPTSHRMTRLEKLYRPGHPTVPFCVKFLTTKSTKLATHSTHLAVAPEGEGVVPLPRLPPAGSRLVVPVALAKTAALLASGSETTAFAMLVDGVDDPVDAGIATDGLVVRVDEDDFVVLVG